MALYNSDIIVKPILNLLMFRFSSQYNKTHMHNTGKGQMMLRIMMSLRMIHDIAR